MNGHKKHSMLNFVITAIFLATILAGLGVLAFMEINAAGATGNYDLKRTLVRMAWLTISLGGLILILLVWMAIRLIKFRFVISIERGSKTEYQDAWALAGRRFKVEEGGEDRSDQPGPDAEGDDSGGTDGKDAGGGAVK
ncbi:MAG: hypothetical protein HZA50_09185 [Planctomycetes bacterium]|nr:hypothetical protein [Planctomycetota bacterium]